MNVSMSDPIITQLRVPLDRGIKTRAQAFLQASVEGDIPRPGYCGCSICRADGDCCGCYVPSSIRLTGISRRKGVVRFKVRSCRNL